MSMTSIDTLLTNLLRRVLGEEAGDLPVAALRWETPKELAFGDFASAAAFKLSPKRRRPPQQIAEELARSLQQLAERERLRGQLERFEPKGGFVNVFLSQRALARVVRQILRAKQRFGWAAAHPPQFINIEFVSANPTGPLSIAHGRQAAVGDVLARLLRSQGHRVVTEFYLNDEGRQIEMLGRSLQARYAQQVGRDQPVPEDGYHGDYLVESAAVLHQAQGAGWLDEPMERFMQEGMREQLAEIRRVLERFGLRFDRWTSQHWVRTSGRIDTALKQLQELGALYESDGATWFASTKYGDDKDRVVKKRDGELTYLAPDIAYHQWKLQQGYDQLINLWGPDHHGYIARLKAAVKALGLSDERLVIRIVQLVTLSRRGKPVPMSKRQGAFVTFRELIEEVGVDASRFFLIMRSMESHLDVDLEVAKAQSDENPVYYVQYAHARICSVLGYRRGRVPAWRLWRPPLGLLQEPEALLLMRQLAQYPLVLRLSAQALEPHAIPTYLQKLAEAFHVFYTKHRVITDDHARSAARLALAQATRAVLAGGLGILGVSAPERM